MSYTGTSDSSPVLWFVTVLKPVCILSGIMVLRLWTYVRFTLVGGRPFGRAGYAINAGGDEAFDGVFVWTTHLLAEELQASRCDLALDIGHVLEIAPDLFISDMLVHLLICASLPALLGIFQWLLSCLIPMI